MQDVVLYSLERIEAVVDGAPPGERGRLFVVEPRKATPVPAEVARFILEHMAYAGAVRVDVTQTDTGSSWDVKKAEAEAEAALREQDELRFKRFVNDCVEDYVKRSKPVPAPPVPILRIIERRGYDLKRYGIVPIGWEEPEKDKRVQQLEEQLKSLTARLGKEA